MMVGDGKIIPKKIMFYFSKSKYCGFWQCPKNAWLTKYKPEEKIVPPETEAVFKTGIPLQFNRNHVAGDRIIVERRAMDRVFDFAKPCDLCIVDVVVDPAVELRAAGGLFTVKNLAALNRRLPDAEVEHVAVLAVALGDIEGDRFGIDNFPLFEIEVPERVVIVIVSQIGIEIGRHRDLIGCVLFRQDRQRKQQFLLC